MSKFLLNDSPLHQEFAQKNVFFESIQSELESFDVPRILIDKVSDTLLIYGEGFHFRLAQILQSCDERQESSERHRAAIINKLLSKPLENEHQTFTFYKEKTCQLALQIWMMFLRIIQFSVLSNSKASGHISNQEKIPQIEIECMINDFLQKSKLFEIESIDAKKKLFKEINDCKQNIQTVMNRFVKNQEIKQSYHQKIDEIKSRTHKKAILSKSLREQIIAQNIEKKKIENEVSEWNKQCVVLQIRSDQLCKKREIIRNQIERLQAATKNSLIRIEDDAQVCRQHQHRYEARAQAISKHEDKMKQKNEELDVFIQHYCSVHRDNLELKQQILERESEKSQLCKENNALNTCLTSKQHELTLLSINSVEVRESFDQKQRVLRQIKDELIAIVNRREEAKDSLSKIQQELNNKIVALELVKNNLKTIDDEIEAAKAAIMELEQTELRFVGECESRKKLNETLKADTIRLDQISKEELLELNNIETVRIMHSKQVNETKDELEIIQEDISRMNIDCNALQKTYDEHEVFMKTDFKKSEKEIEDKKKQTDELIEEVHDCKAQISEMNDKIYGNEKKHCEILTRLKISQCHFDQLTSDKIKYENYYNELMKKYKNMKVEKDECDVQITEFEIKMHRQSIDANEWKTKIFSKTHKFEECVETVKERIKNLKIDQCKLDNAKIESDESSKLLQRAHEAEIEKLRHRNKQKTSLMEKELNDLRNPSDVVVDGDNNLMMRTLKDEIENLEKMITAETNKYKQSKEQIEQLNDENMELSKDWEITRLCKEHLIKEQKDLDEYQCKLQQKMGSLMKKIDDERRKDAETQTLSVGLP